MTFWIPNSMAACVLAFVAFSFGQKRGYDAASTAARYFLEDITAGVPFDVFGQSFKCIPLQGSPEEQEVRPD